MEREKLKPIAENYFPDIIGTNLEYAVEAYVWETHMPMIEDGKIVSGFWDRRKGEEVPEGYEMEEGGRFLSRKGAKALRMTENEIGKIVVDAAVEVLGIFLRDKGQDV